MVFVHGVSPSFLKVVQGVCAWGTMLVHGISPSILKVVHDMCAWRMMLVHDVFTLS